MKWKQKEKDKLEQAAEKEKKQKKTEEPTDGMKLADMSRQKWRQDQFEARISEEVNGPLHEEIEQIAEFNASITPASGIQFVENTDSQAIVPHFLLLVVGKPGSGKSSVIEQLLTSSHLYGGLNRFNHRVIISPSWQKLHIPQLSQEDAMTHLDIGWLDDKIDRISSQQLHFLEQALIRFQHEQVPQHTDPAREAPHESNRKGAGNASNHVGSSVQDGPGGAGTGNYQNTAVPVGYKPLQRIGHGTLMNDLKQNHFEAHALEKLSGRGNFSSIPFRSNSLARLNSAETSQLTGGRHGGFFRNTRGESDWRQRSMFAESKDMVKQQVRSGAAKRVSRAAQSLGGGGYGPNATAIMEYSRSITNANVAMAEAAIKNDEQKQKEMQEQRLQKAAEIIKKLPPAVVASMHTNLLVVLDDVVAEIKSKENDPRLTSLIFNRRHKIANGTISVMIVSQKYTMIPSKVRSNANWLILFKLNPSDFAVTHKEMTTLEMDQWQAMVDFVFGGADQSSRELTEMRFNHLDMHIETNRFFKNFNELSF